MELKNAVKKVSGHLHKYRYGVLVILIGLVLMLLPPFGTESNSNEPPLQETVATPITKEDALARLLQTVSGAGNVKVYLSEQSGSETIYQTDEDRSKTQDTTDTKVSTVIVTGANREQQGLVRQINPPKYLGAIVVCQGADDPQTKLAIVDAVSKATGLGAGSISVLKMK